MYTTIAGTVATSFKLVLLDLLCQRVPLARHADLLGCTLNLNVSLSSVKDLTKSHKGFRILAYHTLSAHDMLQAHTWLEALTCHTDLHSNTYNQAMSVFQ